MNLIHSVFKNKKFYPFFWVQFLGAMNDNIIKNLLVILIAYKGIEIFGVNSQNLIAIVGAVFILPFVLFSPYSGLLADKYNKVKVIQVTKCWELLVMLVATFGFLSENYLLLIVTIFLMGMQSSFFGPVKFSIIPDLVDRKDISNATSYVEFGTFLAILLGTIGGGVLSKMNSWSLYGVVLCFVAIVGILFSFLQPSLEQKDTDVKVGVNIFGGHINLLKVLSGQGKVFNAVILISCFWFFGAALLTVLPTYCQKMLNGNESVVTLFLALFTFGIGAGSLLSGKLSGHKVQLGLVPIGVIGILISVCDFYFYNKGLIFNSEEVKNLGMFFADSSHYRIIVDFILISFFGGIYIVPLYAYVQDQSKKGTLSRVIAVNNIMNALFMVIASVIIIVLNKTGKNSNEILFAIMLIFTVIFILFFCYEKQFRAAFKQYISKG